MPFSQAEKMATHICCHGNAWWDYNNHCDPPPPSYKVPPLLRCLLHRFYVHFQRRLLVFIRGILVVAAPLASIDVRAPSLWAPKGQRLMDSGSAWRRARCDKWILGCQVSQQIGLGRRITVLSHSGTLNCWSGLLGGESHESAARPPLSQDQCKATWNPSESRDHLVSQSVLSPTCFMPGNRLHEFLGKTDNATGCHSAAPGSMGTPPTQMPGSLYRGSFIREWRKFQPVCMGTNLPWDRGE